MSGSHSLQSVANSRRFDSAALLPSLGISFVWVGVVGYFGNAFALIRHQYLLKKLGLFIFSQLRLAIGVIDTSQPILL